MKKTLLVVLLALALVLSFGAAAMAADVNASVGDSSAECKTGDDVKLTYSCQGTVSGTYYQFVFNDVVGDPIQANGSSTNFTATYHATAVGKHEVSWSVKSCATEGGSYTPVADKSGTFTVYVGDSDTTAVIGAVSSTTKFVAKEGTTANGVTPIVIYTSKTNPQASDFNVKGGAATTATPLAGTTFTITAENGKTENYSISFAELSASLGGIYQTAANTKPFDQTGDGEYIVPTGVSTVYAHLSDLTAGVDVYQGSTKLTGTADYYPVTVTDKTDSITLTLKIGTTTLDTLSADLLRPVLSSVSFNKSASFTSDDEVSLTLGTTATYKVDSAWETLYFTPNPLNDDSDNVDYSVKVDSTTVKADSKGWFSQKMSATAYTIKITVEVGDTAANTIENTYTIYASTTGAAGVAIKSFSANEEDDGKGDAYITIIDEANSKLYVFIPYGVDEDEPYYLVELSESKDEVYLNDYTDDKYECEGYWTAIENEKLSKVTVWDYSADLSRVYTVTIFNITDKSAADDSALDDIDVYSGTTSSKQTTDLGLTFAAATKSYSLSVGTATYAKFEISAADKNAYVFLNGKQVELSTKGVGTESGIELDKNTNSFVFNFLVVAEDGEDYTTYTVTLTRGSGQLSTLTVNPLFTGKAMSPAFAPAKYCYTGYVTSGTSSVTVAATAQNSSDTVYINSNGGSSSGTGSASANVSLSNGINIITVYTYNATSKAYTYYYVSVYKPVDAPTIKVSPQGIYVNGTYKGTINAYNVNGNNFLQLRDIAVLLDGTTKEFAVDYNSASYLATMVSNSNYTVNGTENSANSPTYTFYGISIWNFLLDNTYTYPMAYNVNGSNFVMLRDMGILLDFGITYSNNNIYVVTTSSYTPGR